MPELLRRRVADRSVREALSLSRQEFLPTEISEDDLAVWVMGFDDLRLRSDLREKPFRRDDEYGVFWALDLVTVSALQKQMPFYFASLFQIGRQWKVSEKVLASLEGASSEESLRATARLNQQTDDDLARDRIVSRLFEQSGPETTEALSFLLRSAREHHTERLHQSRRWWQQWRDEVRRLREQVNEVQQISERRPDYRLWREIAGFVLRDSQGSPLRISMEVAGVHFADGGGGATATRLAVAQSDPLIPLLFLGFGLAGSRGPVAEEFYFEWRHILHDLRYEAEYRESRRIALERLARKYSHGEDDPFESYMPLQKPASEHLRNLVIEHTLPGNQLSPWLSTWRRCIEFNSATAVRVPVKDLTESNSVKAFARDADCAIKQALPNEFRPGETWKEFHQRLFEFEWVLKVAAQIISNDANAQGWDFARFVELVTSVVGALNKSGYELERATKDRLRKLWDRLHGDKPWSVTDW
jgi:hypothetical protein